MLSSRLLSQLHKFFHSIQPSQGLSLSKFEVWCIHKRTLESANRHTKFLASRRQEYPRTSGLTLSANKLT